jgi:hypothetical protein
MAFAYEALVGHLYVVGGRSISAAPPGTLVEVAPKKAARGREADTFFVLVLPSGESVAPARFYQQMSQRSAERYFNSGGSVTAGLRTVFNTLNEYMFEHNATERASYEASLICAVLRGNDLYLARVGSAVAVFHHADKIQTFPADFSNDEALFSPPLGVQPVPDIKMARHEVESGTRLAMSDVGLADIEISQLERAMIAGNIGEVLLALRSLAPRQIILTAVEFVPPQVAAPIPVREGESTANLNMSKAPDKTDTATAAATHDKQKRERKPNRLIVWGNSIGSNLTLGTGKIVGVFGKILDIVMPQPKPGQKSIWSSPAMAGLTIFIPLLVVIMVVALWLGNGDKSVFDLCVEEADEASQSARGIASSDVPGTLAAWNAVVKVVESCNAIRPGDVQMQALMAEAQLIIDHLLQIDRRQPLVLTSFANAGLKRIVQQGDDIYVLDDTNDLVYRVKLTADGRAIIPGTQQPIQSMRRTAAVEEFQIGDLLDIIWADDSAGLSQGNVLLGLDRNGVLIECPPRFLESLSCDAQQLPDVDAWVDPASMFIWQGRIYILDPGANQIWRYEPGPGAFTNRPTEYFIGEARPDIRRAIDFAIDETGHIYLLMADGVLERFDSGDQVPFGYASFPENFEINSADGLFLNTDPIAQGLYLVSQANRTIYETTLAGTFIAAYRANEEDLFDSVSDVVVDVNLGMIYALSGNSILAFERTRPDQ